MKLCIVGGGASGLFLAAYLSKYKKNIDITIYDKNKSLGRKILASGNGRCNFSNLNATSIDYNHPLFMDALFKKVSKEELFSFFEKLGLSFYADDEGRMYPITESSETILNLFLAELKNIKICLEEVNTIIPIHGKYEVNGIIYDALVIASGSNSNIDIKKTSSTYGYFKSLNLKMTDLRPSLVGFKIENMNLNDLKGYRRKVDATLLSNNELIHKEPGEVIFKEDGISGIVIMNMSFYCDMNKNNRIVLDLYPSISLEEMIDILKIRSEKYNAIEDILAGLVHPKMIQYLKNIKVKNIEKIAYLLKNFSLTISSTYDFKDSQVTRGGIDLSEINEDFSLKKYPNVYAIGEALDIDGKCGGYNLMFAFLSALACGKEMLKL